MAIELLCDPKNKYTQQSAAGVSQTTAAVCFVEFMKSTRCPIPGGHACASHVSFGYESNPAPTDNQRLPAGKCPIYR